MKFSVVTIAALATLASVSTAAETEQATTTLSGGEVTTSTTSTHKYGKFNKTSRSHGTTTGTHSYGRFNKTRTHAATAVQNKAAENSAAPSNLGPLKLLGVTAGSAIVAGALLLL